jgi:hypothetical protein
MAEERIAAALARLLVRLSAPGVSRERLQALVELQD